MSDAEVKYLETIYSLTAGEQRVKTQELATQLGVTAPSATEMLKRLASGGYVDYTPYHGAELTARGLKIALRSKRKHRLLERFLHDILGIPVERVHTQAEKLEHGLSDEAEQALCRLLGHPDSCPDDHQPIPLCPHAQAPDQCPGCDPAAAASAEAFAGSQALDRDGLSPVSSLPMGARCVIAIILGGQKAQQRLADMGLTTDTELEVKNIAPFGGPIEVSVRESRLVLGRGLAQKILTRPCATAGATA